MVNQTKVVFIGSGNVATQLGLALKSKGITISQIYSRTEANAKELADRLECKYTSDIEEIYLHADIYIYALKDSYFVNFLKNFNLPEEAIHIHTAGSIHISDFEGLTTRYGVFYPLQTFSKNKPIDFSEVPICIETSNELVEVKILELAYLLTKKVYIINSDQRKQLHLAAVFACNFSNYMYDIASELVGKAGLGFEILQPLILETANKVKFLSPYDAQTGPAVRYDRKTINTHLWFLRKFPELKKIYLELSKNIHIRHTRLVKKVNPLKKIKYKIYHLIFSKNKR
ncbi:MAG: DUF2520 domain-containing protein [Paludibacter sp.]